MDTKYFLPRPHLSHLPSGKQVLERLMQAYHDIHAEPTCGDIWGYFLSDLDGFTSMLYPVECPWATFNPPVFLEDDVDTHRRACRRVLHELIGADQSDLTSLFHKADVAGYLPQGPLKDRCLDDLRSQWDQYLLPLLDQIATASMWMLTEGFVGKDRLKEDLVDA